MATTSRYAGLPVLTHTGPGGRTVSYFGRRILPAGSAMPLVMGVTVTQGDRLDLIAARTFGDPEQYWRICDANDVMRPDELEQVGRVIDVSMPKA